MKLCDLITLRNIFGKHLTDDIPMQTAYKVFKLVKRADSESEFYTKRLHDVIEKYGVRNEKNELQIDGNAVKMDEAKRDEWQKAFAEIDNLTVDFSVEFTLDELSVFTFSVADMSVLSNYIKEFKDGSD